MNIRPSTYMFGMVGEAVFNCENLVELRESHGLKVKELAQA
ncbi:MAG: hypothetical protein ACUZ8E_15650 [Candidatus Anammoxibacter sp.]